MSNLLKKLLSYGNKKLPKTTAIFNMTPAMYCPSDKLGLCQVSAICYAKKSESLYPQVLPYRVRQAKYYKATHALRFVSDFIEAISTKHIKIDSLRINESGDFGSQSDVDKLSHIAQLLQAYSIKVYVYTANDSLNFDNLMKYATVNGSNKMYSNRFLAVNKINRQKVYCVGNCNICNLCTFNLNATIQVLKH